jgi:long-chain acyl-CoA synthetase
VATVTAERAPATLVEFVETLAAHGRRTAVIDYSPVGKRSLDYETLTECIFSAALRLGRAGIGPSSTVALWGPNGADWLTAYFALVYRGALVVPLDHQSSAAALSGILDHAAPDLIVTTAAHCAELAAAQRTTRTLPLDELAAAREPRLAAPDSALPAGAPLVTGDRVAALLYTSGTTGTPKAVPLTHRNLLSNTLALCAADVIAADDRVLLPLPLHHTYPFTVGLLTVLARGATVVFPAGISGPEIAAAARDAHPTALLAVPRLCEALWSGVCATVERRGKWATRLFRVLLTSCGGVRRLTGLRAGLWIFRSLHDTFGGRLEVIGCGGARLDPELARRLEALGWTVLTGYGLTETSPVLTFNSRSNSRLGTEGRPLAGVELAIRRADRPAAGDVAAGADQGEIVARGASVFRGYRGNDAATQAAFTADGWFRTGDLGWIDAAGYLHVVGRSKELIALADGKKIFPEELEKIYAAAPLIREIAILEQRGRLVALVVPNETAILERGALREVALLRETIEDIGARLPPYQRITGYGVVRSMLPRTQLGKLKRHLLAELYTQATDAAPREAQALPAEDAALVSSGRPADVWRWIQGRFPGRALTLDASPQLDLDIDSLEWVSLTLEIEERFGVALSGDAVSRILTVRDLLREIESAAPAQPGAAAAKTRVAVVELPSAPLRALGAVVFALAWAVMRIFFRLRVAGRSPLDTDIPMLIAPNHTSYLDPPAIAAALPWRRLRKTFWAGWVGILYTGPFTRFISRACQVLPVDPDRDIAGAIETARSLLRRGYSIVWFPEGRRSPTGELGHFLQGIGRVVLHSDADAVPVAIRGTFDAWPKHRLLPRLKRVSVTFGEPLRFCEQDPDGRAVIRISEDIENTVRTLLSLETNETQTTPVLDEPTDEPKETEMTSTTNQWLETLRDGRRALIRPIRRDDVDRNAAFLDSLSQPSRHFLFLAGVSRLSGDELRRLCDPDYAHDMAYVAIDARGGDGGDGQRQIGVCRYAGSDAEKGAEISVAVADDWQHCGLGKQLLTRLIDYARAHGVARLYSVDSLANSRMRKLARDLGFLERTDPDDPSQVICSLDLAAPKAGAPPFEPGTGQRLAGHG